MQAKRKELERQQTKANEKENQEKSVIIQKKKNTFDQVN